MGQVGILLPEIIIMLACGNGEELLSLRQIVTVLAAIEFHPISVSELNVWIKRIHTVRRGKIA